MKLFIGFTINTETNKLKIVGVSKSEKYLKTRYGKVFENLFIEEYDVVEPDFLKLNRHRTVENRRELINAYKRECLICLGKEDLTFHHMRDKMTEVSPLIGDFEVILKEIKKCVVLCRDCHDGIHLGEIEWINEWRKMTNSKYMKIPGFEKIITKRRIS